MKLQVALDLLDLNKALKIAKNELIDIVEVGTPLLKKYGSSVIKKIREITDKEIFVDTKTVDVAKIEALIVKDEGGNIFSVLALAPFETLLEARDACREYGVKLCVDLLGIDNPLSIIEKINEINPDIICFHVGVDVQKRRKVTIDSLINEIRTAKEKIRSEIAVAGGINDKNIKLFSGLANIVIVGGYIYNSENPDERIKILKNLINL